MVILQSGRGSDAVRGGRPGGIPQPAGEENPTTRRGDGKVRVPPVPIPDYLALVGDGADGVPGIAG